MTSKELREKRAEVYAEMKESRELATTEGREWTSEDEQKWERINKEYDAYTRKIEIVEREAKAEAEQRQPADDLILPGRDDSDGREHRGNDGASLAEDREVAFRSWFLYQAGADLSERQQQACQRIGFNPSKRNLDFEALPQRDIRAAAEHMRSTHPGMWKRDLSSLYSGTGGATVPSSFVNMLETNMLYFGPMLQVSDIIRTDSGEDMTWPTADDTGNTGVQLGEGASIGSSVDPSFASITWNAYKFSSGLVKVPFELLQDSAFDIGSEIGRMLGERLGRVLNTKCTTGNGAGTAKGVTVAATLGKTAASATAIIADELIDLEHSVDIAYRTADARYMMHDSVLQYIRKLKDGEGRYMFQMNMREGGPDTINGRQFSINNDMASSVATTNITVLFGQFSKYKVRQVAQIRLRRLVERYADNDQEGFVAFIRADGNLLDAGTAPIKYLQQA